MMDHTGIAQIMYEPPKSDGSTCTLMAASLRLDVKHNLDEQELYSELWAHAISPLLLFLKLSWSNSKVVNFFNSFVKLRNALSLPFSTALGVHFDQMTRDEFRETVNLNWNWLDGTSLLWTDQKYFVVFTPIAEPIFSNVLWMIQGDYFALTPPKNHLV